MSHRQARRAHELRDRLAAILSTRVSDPRLREVTITGVEVSPDFSFARVFFRTLGDRAVVEAALARAKSFFRRQLADVLAARRVPELDFRLDESIDEAARVEEILRELRDERERCEQAETKPGSARATAGDAE